VSIITYARRAVIVNFAVQTETAEAATQGASILNNYLSSVDFTTALKSQGGGLAGIITASGLAVQPAPPVNTTSTWNDDTKLDDETLMFSLIACLVFVAVVSVPIGYWYYTVLNEIVFELVPPAPLTLICDEPLERVNFVNPYLPVGGCCWVALEEEKKKEQDKMALKKKEQEGVNPHARHDDAGREDY